MAMLNNQMVYIYIYGLLLPDAASVKSFIWLVVWNMNFIFPNSWNDDPIWRTYIFQGGWNHQLG